jgi:hypothetical protein
MRRQGGEQHRPGTRQGMPAAPRHRSSSLPRPRRASVGFDGRVRLRTMAAVMMEESFVHPFALSSARRAAEFATALL